jgi:two-component system, NarL family, invasion response regulator UvrY
MEALSPDRVGVLGVDDQVVFLDVAEDVVAATPGFHWVGGATSGREALDAVRDLKPELVLLDMRMPDMDGIETARRIHARHPATVVVLISVEETPAADQAVATSGAAALVRKRDFGPALLRRLWRVHSRPER